MLVPVMLNIPLLCLPAYHTQKINMCFHKVVFIRFVNLLKWRQETQTESIILFKETDMTVASVKFALFFLSADIVQKVFCQSRQTTATLAF